jgi:hypothetical protein
LANSTRPREQRCQDEWLGYWAAHSPSPLRYRPDLLSAVIPLSPWVRAERRVARQALPAALLVVQRGRRAERRVARQALPAAPLVVQRGRRAERRVVRQALLAEPGEQQAQEVARGAAPRADRRAHRAAVPPALPAPV